MKWSKRDLDRDEVRAIATRYGCDNLTASVLYRRSVAGPREARWFLESDPRQQHNPFRFQQMEKAVDRLRAAIASGETIHVFGDRDVDGVTATVLLQESLRDLGAKVQVAMPVGDDEYGLTEKWVRDVAGRGGTLIVTVDCGISARREVAVAAELGIDVVITDHHNPPDDLPECHALIDPKAPGEVYPFRELCGCAVAWKLDWALHWAQTPEYGHDVLLLAARPANDSVSVDAVRVRNLCVRESITEVYVPGGLRWETTRLRSFLGDGPVVVLDAAATARHLEEAFGAPLPLAFRDLGPDVQRLRPDLAGQSLLKMLQAAEVKRYAEQPLGEIDMLRELYVDLRMRDSGPALEKPLGRLDLVALGTLSDLMSLRDENRVLVRRGMEILSSAPRRGLRELLDAQELLGRRITTRDVAWKLSPVLNAAGRMGKPEVALDLFLSPDMEGAAKRAGALLDLNKQRKAAGDKVWDECRSLAEESLARTGGRLVLAAGPRILWGITGVIAARLTAVFKTPAVVISVNEAKCVGSVRSPEGFSLAGFLDQFHDLLSTYGGHDYAAGFSLPPERLEAFRERLLAVGGSLDLPRVEEETLTIDAELPPVYLTPKLIRLIDRFEPYGEGNPPLTFLSRGLVVENVELIGKGGGESGPPHARLLLAAEATRWPAVYWNGAERVRQELPPASRVDVVYRVERNHFMNMESLRLTILDFAR